MLYPICTALSSLLLVCFIQKCSVLCFSGLFQSALRQICYFVFVFVHARHTLLSLCVCSNSQRNTLNNGSKDQNRRSLVEYVTVWTNLSTGGGTKRQQSFLFLRGMKCICFFWPINVVKMWWRNHVLYGASEYPNETSPDNLCFTTLLKVFR